MSDIVELLKGWAYWRIHTARDEVGWPTKTITGQLLDGMPSTVCTLCHGHGQLPGWRVGVEAPKVDCPQCDADGKVKAASSDGKVNPAFISGTGVSESDDDPRYYAVDRAVCALRQDDKTISLYFVVLYEYTRSGRAEDKANRMRIGSEKYLSLLEVAHVELARKLGLDKPDAMSILSA